MRRTLQRTRAEDVPVTRAPSRVEPRRGAIGNDFDPLPTNLASSFKNSAFHLNDFFHAKNNTSSKSLHLQIDKILDASKRERFC